IGQLPDLALRRAWMARRVIASAGMFDREFEDPIITPFIIPVVLAALWSVLRFGDDWGLAVGAAIRLGGEVDTLGALVGSLMGIRRGASAIPRHLAAHVADAAAIRRLAEDYCRLAVGPA